MFRASETSISAGERVTLRWETRRGSRLSIEDDRGNEIFRTTDDDEADKGETIVRPVRDTRYMLTVERGSRRDTCTERVVVVEGQEVSVITTRDQEPLTFISLAEVPSTGFDASQALSVIFYLLLSSWAGLLGHVFVIKKGAAFGLG